MPEVTASNKPKPLIVCNIDAHRALFGARP
jgi:hypothetical protein